MKNKRRFELSSKYKPSGDQPRAIEDLVRGLENNFKNQVLLGVTGSGKTFTMANIINRTQRPSLIMAHNKTLAAQLYSEIKNFFPNNAVEYFISFFDYYQPEAYVPSSDVYVDKDSSINAKLDQMKHSAIYSSLERRDLIIVASISCIYGIGERSFYEQMKLLLSKNQEISIEQLSLNLVNLQYIRNDISFERGTFRVKGDIVEIFPAHLEEEAIRLSFFGDEIERIDIIDALTSKRLNEVESFRIYAATLYITPSDVISHAIPKIKVDLQERIDYFKQQNRLIEAQRIEERTNFDIEMLQSTGYCKGIENYIRYLTGRDPGETPSTLFDYLPEDTIIFVDESHVSVSQVRGMFNADRSRKQTLSDYGFRLPSCMDNRPLTFEEWQSKRGNTIFVSATPGEFELKQSNNQVVEQLIRPTGLLDPECFVRPVENQTDDLIGEIKKRIPKGEKVLAITLTKKMAEHIADYFNENSIRTKYIHSDIDSIERVQIINSLRQDELDVLVGINLLREGLDIPECTLVAILDADKEGFLRSKTSLVQTIGRAARNSNGIVILYGDKITESMKYAIDETNRRREKQKKYNLANNIKPQTVISKIVELDLEDKGYRVSKSSKKNLQAQAQEKANLEQQVRFKDRKEIEKYREKLVKEMDKLAENLEFEKAIEIRSKIKTLDDLILETFSF